MKEKLVEIETDGKKRTFIVKKFDARTGSYVIYTVLNRLLPSILEFAQPEARQKLTDGTEAVTEMATKVLTSSTLSEAEFLDLQNKCLRVCYEVLPAGNTPIITSTGQYGVIGLEDDLVTIFRLTLEALVFNLRGFFTGGGLTQAFQSLQGMKSAN